MAKDISEMTIEELEEYAKSLETKHRAAMRELRGYIRAKRALQEAKE